MTAKTPAERQAAKRARRADAGLTRLELWAHPEDHAALKEQAAKMQARRERRRTQPGATMTKRDERITLWVPLIFWSDHADRCPCDNPDTDMATEVREAGRRVLIEATPRQLEVLRSDAAFYCDRDGPDECPPGLVRSARATLDAIAKATGKAASVAAR